MEFFYVIKTLFKPNLVFIISSWSSSLTSFYCQLACQDQKIKVTLVWNGDHCLLMPSKRYKNPWIIVYSLILLKDMIKGLIWVMHQNRQNMQIKYKY